MTIYDVLRRPIETEKSRHQTAKLHQYVFEVDRRATKPQIKEAVEALSALILFSLGALACGGRGGGELTYLGSSLWTKAHDVEIRGDRAYCGFLDGFAILDLSDPRDPATLSQIHLGGGFAVALAGNLALVAAADKGFALKPEMIAKFKDCGVHVLDAADDVFAAALNYLKLDPNTTAQADLDKAADLLTKIRPSVRKFHSSEYLNALASGEICLVSSVDLMGLNPFWREASSTC